MDCQGLTLDLIKSKIQAFQIQNQNQSVEENSACFENCPAKNLIDQLIHILEKENEARQESPQFPVPVPALPMPMPTGKTSPKQKAMTNSLVVREILSYMDARALLQLRQVNRLWKEEAGAILLSSQPQPFFCVRFEWWKKRGEFCSENTYSLSDFMQDFGNVETENWSILKFSHLIFTGGSLNEPTLVQFFKDFGSHVQHLGLFPETPKPPKTLEATEMAALQNNIFKWTLNVKTLSLKQSLLELEIEDAEGEIQNENEQLVFPQLPNLQKIILPNPNSSALRPQSLLLNQILTSAPNLSSIEDPILVHIPQITSAGKLAAVRSLKWDFGNSFWDPFFLAFVTAGPQLKSFCFEDAHDIRRHRIGLLEAIRTLLQLGQNTLENLKGIEQLGGISEPNFQLSPLMKVTELHLSHRAGPGVDRILPQGNALSEVFPNLKVMHVEDDGSSSDWPWTSPLNAHSGLKKLKVTPWDDNSQYKYMFEPVFAMPKLYPNVTHIHFDLTKMGDPNPPYALLMLPWSFEEVEEIILEFRINKDTPAGFKREMDEAITGFPSDFLEILWGQREPNEEYQKLEVIDDEIRDNPSIFDIQKLTNLTFIVHFEKSPQPLWTHVAEFYAFQPMAKRQGLEVNIRAVQSKRVLHTGFDLRPIKPNLPF